jgi:hypothetical protein
MKSPMWVWGVSALLLITLPFDPVLNRPLLALALFVLVSVVCGVSLIRAMRSDIARADAGADRQADVGADRQ